jgi:antitoxin YefM
MTTCSISEAKMKLSALADAVNTTQEEVVITKNGKPVAVLVSHDEFASWRETMQIRFDADFMKEIKKGLTALKKDKASLYTLEELLD